MNGTGQNGWLSETTDIFICTYYFEVIKLSFNYSLVDLYTTDSMCAVAVRLAILVGVCRSKENCLIGWVSVQLIQKGR